MTRRPASREQDVEELRRAGAHVEAGAVAEAKATLDRLIARAPEFAEARQLRAYLLWRRFGDGDAARRDVLAILSRTPDHRGALANLAEIERRSGNDAEAAAAAERLLALDPHSMPGLITLTQVRAATLAPEHIAALERLTVSAPARDRAMASHLLGLALDAQGDDAGAFARFEASHANPSARYDRAAIERAFAEIRHAFDRATLGARRSGRRDPRPTVFVVGMPRSGTTLVERLFLAHGDVASAGESYAVEATVREVLRNTPTHGGTASLREAVASLDRTAARRAGARLEQRLAAEARPAGRRLRLSKMPHDVRHLGFIEIVTPGSTLLHMTRDPLDTGLSCYFQLFESGNEYNHRLEDIGHFYRLWLGLRAHWREVLGERVIEVSYERLVSDFAAEAARLVEAAGLPWSPSCLAPERAKGVVRTASASQVRRPVSARSIGRWRRHEDRLRPLIEALGGPSGVAAIRRELGIDA